MKKLFMFLIIFVSIFATNVYAESGINITDAKVIDKSSTITVDNPVLENNTISSNIKFNQINDYVVYELTFKNNDSFDYNVAGVVDNNTNGNLLIEYDYSDELLSNGNGTLRIKLTYKNKLFNVDKLTLDNLEIKMNLTKSDGSKTQISLTNPKTGNNIYRYIILLMVSVVGVVLTKKKIKLKNVKVGNLLLVIAVLLVPFTIFALEKLNFKISFSDVEIVGEYEVYDIDVGDITREITYGQEIGELPTPEKTGYTFVKWEDDNGNTVTSDTVITKPISLTPKYLITEYTITYNLNDGEATNITKYTVEDEFTLNNPTKDGYTFSGWTGSNGNNLDTSVTVERGTTGNLTFNANYTPSEYVITFDPTDGQVTQESILVDAGQAANSFPVPTREDYDFVGWYSGDTLIETPFIPTQDITLTAHWEENDNLVKYTDSDNSGTINLGDLVKLGNDRFYVVDSDNSYVKLLAEYNLDSNSRQSENNYLTEHFSNSNYWYKDPGTSGSDPYNEYITDSYGYYNIYRNYADYDGENNLHNYISNYKDYLEGDVGISDINDARIMSYTEANNTGCYNNYTNSCPEYVANQSYWLGSLNASGNEDRIMYIQSTNRYLSEKSYDNNLGVRPLIVINRSVFN